MPVDGRASAECWPDVTLWGVTPILTLPLLARCDRLLGITSQSLVFTTYHITRGFDLELSLPDRLANKLRQWTRLPFDRVFRRLVLLYVLLRYDCIHTFNDRAILVGPDRFGIDRKELATLAACGKRLYTYAYGADVRGREATLTLGSPNICQECPEPGRFCVCDGAALASVMERLDGVATARIAMGDMTVYVPGCRDMHYWPLDLDRLKPAPAPSRKGRPLRVAHAPNHAHFKGSRFLEAAIHRLTGEGYAIELVRVSGVTNEKVIELFAGCDLVADQFIAGFHGYTALEAMALGRPVLCFLRGPEMMMDPATCPIINTCPETVYDVLLACLLGRLDLDSLGRQSRAYVERHYSLKAVAVRLGRLYIDTAALPPLLTARIEARVRALECELSGAAAGRPAEFVYEQGLP